MKPRASVLSKRRVTVAVIAALLVRPDLLLTRVGASGLETVSSTPATSLTVESDPPGAAIYVDGRLNGFTPLAVTKLSPGDHRIRLQKEGYLENARVVAVGSGNKRLRIALTPHRGPQRAAAQIEAGGGQVGKRSKWPLILGLAAGGGTAAFFVPNGTSNHAPTAGSIATTPATGIVATLTTFTAVGANDSDGDAMTFAWTFGDGGTGSGSTVSHAYTAPGTKTVGVTVSDGRAAPAAATLDLVVTSLTDSNWSGAPSGWSSSATVALNQSGTDLTGTFTDSNGSAPLAGTIDESTRQLTFVVTFTSPPRSMRFVGLPSSAVRQLVGTCYNLQATNCGQSGTPWTLTRP
jgi:PKD domain-containing protein/PEGA domain-containing protein